MASPVRNTNPSLPSVSMQPPSSTAGKSGMWSASCVGDAARSVSIAARSVDARRRAQAVHGHVDRRAAAPSEHLQRFGHLDQQHLLVEVAGGASATLDVVRRAFPHIDPVRSAGASSLVPERPSAVTADDLAGHAQPEGL